MNRFMHRFYIRFTTIIFFFGHLLPCLAQDKTVDFRYFDSNLPFDERVEILLNQMTLEEKISQMTNESKAIPRLEIPEYNWWNECLHGVARAGYATVFPQSITIAASFDRTLVEDVASVISDEARAKHHEFVRNNKRVIYTGLDFWSPNINIFRDPRWGRGHETYGEDPYLTGELATCFIEGLQGHDSTYLKTIATAKHFAVHSGPEALRHSFDVDVSDRDLYETYLPAFYKTITEAKVYSVMGAYNRFRGESCSGHPFLLNELLRNTWGFDGYVVSDCGAVRDIHTGHHLANSKAEAAAMGLKGGCDLNCGSYYNSLADAVQEGLVSENDIDVALRRILMARFKLGMFDSDDKVPFAHLPISTVCSDAHNYLAKRAARESIVLLKNSDDILPLSKTDIQSIAVIGPNADNWESLVGNYNGTPKHPVTFLKGIQNKVSPELEVMYAEGAHLDAETLNLKPIPSFYLQTEDGKSGLVGEYYNNTNWQGKPTMVRVDDQVDFSWQYNPISEVLRDTFSIRWKGYLIAPDDGLYQLGGFSKRGMSIAIDGKEIAYNKGSIHHPKYLTADIRLKKGKKYAIEIKYFSDETNAQVSLLWAMPEKNLVDEAVAVAQKADVTVLVLGLSQRLEGEGGDRTDIDLPQTQQKLLEAISATNKPLILVINAGSALAINWAKEHANAIINVGYPGEEGGNALADVLWGDYNPAGRLPMTYYTSLDELPDFENYSMEGRTYRYYHNKALYPFGYGLSYTNFEYSNLKLPQIIKAGEDLVVEVTVSNAGKRDGDEVVQLYVKDMDASTPRPIKQLEGFQRIYLKAGESKTVSFTLKPRQLSMIDKKGSRVIEPGWFKIFIGGMQPGCGSEFEACTQILEKKVKVKGNMHFDIP